MSELNTKKIKGLDIFTVGFALFAMFFGAGNLIFPPYLGWQLGDHWFPGFLCYLAVDIGFSFIAMLVIARKDKGSESITEKLGKRLSTIFLGVICICIGPAIAIPRVASITYEVGIAPNFSNANRLLCTVIFFAIVFCLCIRQSSVVDIVGKVLSPLMVIALLVMIVKGIISPIGEIRQESLMSDAAYMGITSGYQTMDMMAAVIFAITIIYSINQKGYKEKKQHFVLIIFGGLIASMLLFVVYGGLAYIGATYFPSTRHLDQVSVLTNIVMLLMGKTGMLLLGLVVALACMTTAIGLITSISEFFEEKLHINYKLLVIAFTLISFLLSNLGTDIIINMAAPVLNVVYPVLITLTFCSVAGNKLPDEVYKCSAGFAFVVSLVQQIEAFAKIEILSQYLPFGLVGFGWVLPAIIGAICGMLYTRFCDWN